MSSIRRIVALFLVAVWLPAVLHCRIESLAGVDCCAGKAADHGQGKSCDGDICDGLEAGFTKFSSEQLVVAPHACCCLICCTRISEPAEISAPLVTGVIEEGTAPPEIIQSRHFLARCALPARDPDCVS